jgi:lipopolysaccharide transport protein LptA
MLAARLAIIALVLAGASLASAGEPPPERPEGEKKEKAVDETPREPLHVWADRIRYLRDEHIASVTGNATIIKQDLRIDANTVIADLEEKTNRFKKITATGNVRIYSIAPIPERTTQRPPLRLSPEGRRGRCEKAVYDPATGVVILSGSDESQPVVWVGKDKVRANKITYDRTKNTLRFEGKVHLSALVPKETERPTPAPPPE